MIFRGNEHKVIYTSFIKKINKPIYQISSDFLSALYLLTSYTKLWNKAKLAFESQRIDFTKICLKNTNRRPHHFLSGAEQKSLCHV
jgi:hypothetical protein